MILLIQIKIHKMMLLHISIHHANTTSLKNAGQSAISHSWDWIFHYYHTMVQECINHSSSKPFYSREDLAWCQNKQYICWLIKAAATTVFTFIHFIHANKLTNAWRNFLRMEVQRLTMLFNKAEISVGTILTQHSTQDHN